MKLFKVELSRAFNIRFLISVIIGCIFTLFPAVMNYINELESKRLQLKYDGKISLDLLTGAFSRWFGSYANYDIMGIIFFTIFPVIASFPYGDSYFIDMKSGYVKHIFTRTGKRCYYNSKFFAAFISGGLAVTIPLLLSFLCTSVYSPWRLPDQLISNVYTDTFLSNLYFNAPIVYIFLYLTIDFIFGGIFAVMSLAISRFAANRFTVLLFPLLFCLFVKYILVQFPEFYEWDISASLNITELVSSGVPMLLESILLFTLSYILFIFGNYKSDVL